MKAMYPAPPLSLKIARLSPKRSDHFRVRLWELLALKRGPRSPRHVFFWDGGLVTELTSNEATAKVMDL